MRRIGGSTRVGAMVAGLAIVAAACGSSGSSNKNSNASQTTAGGTKQGGVFRLGIVEPTAIDPYNSQESEGENVTKAVFEGLVTVDNATAEIKPGVAQSWTKNDACTVWNFKLFPGTQFSNGETLTAQSFIDGWNRAAQQKAASDTAEFMSDVQASTPSTAPRRPRRAPRPFPGSPLLTRTPCRSP